MASLSVITAEAAHFQQVALKHKEITMADDVDSSLNNCSGMNECDRLIFDTLLNQRSELLASLRTIDGALYQVAFAYIGAFALCVPAIVTGSATIEQLEQWLWLVSFIVCQIVFIGAVYALLLVKSRNTNLGLMAHVERRINSIITRNYGQINKVLFQSTTEISRYYLGKDGGVGWLCLYVPLLCVLSLGVGYSCFLSWGMAPVMSAILILEVIFIAAMYVIIFRTSGLKSARRIIEKDYSEWFAGVGDKSDNSSEGERI